MRATTYPKPKLVARLFFTMLLAIGLIPGCARLMANKLQAPGTWQQQRSRAIYFDPFPSADAGPPVMGLRPRGFDRPLPEAEQSQVIPRSMLPR